MLSALRNAAAGAIAKAFIGLLVLSFAVWGVADIFGGYGSNTLATVGSTEVTATEFQRAYQRELSAMADRIGRQLTPDEARALGVDRRVLAGQLTAATLTNQARGLGLGVSEAYLAERIVADPTFTDAFGRFDRDLFEIYLSRLGYTEPGYVAELERAETRAQITDTVAGHVRAPDALVVAFRDFLGARRVVDYITLPAIDPATIAAPDEAALNDFYQANQAMFTAPELRGLALVALEPADLTDTIVVPEEQIAESYEARRFAYETVERREVDQLLLGEAEQAAEASQKIAAGRDFVEVAGDYGFTASDIDLGDVAQSEIVDPQIAAAAFALAEGAVSEPIEGGLGTAIVRIRAITPARGQTLDEVRDEIREAIALERAADEVLDLRNAVEDELGGGLGLAEIARKLDLRLIEVPAVDRRGNGPDGAKIAALPDHPAILRTAFESDVGLENDVIETTTGGFFWVAVTSVTAERLKPFADVRAEVETAWRQAEAVKRLRERAEKLAAQGRDASDLAAVATEAGVPVVTSEPFTRRAPNAPFAAPMVQAVFAAPAGAVLTGRPREGEAMVVARVKELVPAEALGETDRRAYVQQIQSAVGVDLLEQYITGLQGLYGQTVNQVTLNALVGVDS